MNIDLNILKALLNDNKYRLSILSNASAYLNESIDNINWVGFYLLDKDTLYLGPFQGKPACILIPVGKGVCGDTVAKKQTIVVDNVLEYKGHIACDSNSRSEICIPIYINNNIYGLLDIDSPIFNRFNENLKDILEKCVKIIENALINAK